MRPFRVVLRTPKSPSRFLQEQRKDEAGKEGRRWGKRERERGWKSSGPQQLSIRPGRDTDTPVCYNNGLTQPTFP